MINKEDFEEHDHEIICSWDEEKESYKEKVSKIFFVLENKIKKLEKDNKKLKKDFKKLGNVLLDFFEADLKKIEGD